MDYIDEHLSSSLAICHLLFSILHLPFSICPLPFTIYHLPFMLIHANYWHISCPSQPRKKSAILFLHGFLGSGADWQEIIGCLEADYNCIAIDLPGHGRTKVRDAYSFSMHGCAESIMKILDQLHIKKCCLAGYSMGGRLGLYLLLNWPKKFYAGIFESSSPGLESESERANRIESDAKIADKIEKTPFKDFLRNWYQQPLFDTLRQHPRFPQLWERRMSNNPGQLARSIRFMGTGRQPSLWDKLEQNKLPVLLVSGSFDEKYEKIASQMQSRGRNFNAKIMGNCGHNTHFEKPVLFAETMQNFIVNCQKTIPREMLAMHAKA